MNINILPGIQLCLNDLLCPNGTFIIVDMSEMYYVF